MNNTQKIVFSAVMVVGLYAFITAGRKKTAEAGKKQTASFTGNDDFMGLSGLTVSKKTNPDPFMMLEVKEWEFPNATGQIMFSKNNPFGELFENRKIGRVSAQPFNRKA